MVFLAYAAILFLQEAPPSLGDYANWTYQGVLLAHHLQGVADPAHWLKTYPVPNSAATLMIGLFCLVMPWVLAAKLWLAVQLGFSFFAARRLLVTLGSGGWIWLLLPQCVFFNVNFWYGFVNFQMGLCWVLLIASMLLRRGRLGGSVYPNWPLGLVLVLAFFTHMFAFALCGLLLLLYVFQTGRRRPLWQLLPSVMLSAWYLWGRFALAGNADGQAGMAPTVPDYSPAFWLFKGNSYLKSLGFVDPGGAAPGWLGRPLFLALLGVTLCLAGLVLWMLLRAAWIAFHGGVSEERFLWIGVAVLVPLYLLAPGTALGVSDPGARLLQMALALALPLSARTGGRLTAGAAVCAFGLTLAGIALFFHLGAGVAPPMVDTGPATAMTGFARVPNHDMDYFYPALVQGDMEKAVFPTGMFLNRGEDIGR